MEGVTAARLAEFEAIVLGNLSEHNHTRQTAEQMLTHLRTSQPSAFMLCLLGLLRESQQQQAREFAAVILRQNLLINSSSQVWSQCPPAVQHEIQAGLLFLFQREPSSALRRKITDAIAATATRISGKVAGDFTTDENGISRSRAAEQVEKSPDQTTPWPELMPTVLQLAQANAPETRQSLCDLIDKLAEFNPSMLHDHLQACKIIIVGGMRDAQMTTRLSALRACVSLLDDLNESQREHMKDTVPLMFEILGSAYAQADEETIIHAVTALSNLAELSSEGGGTVASGAKFLKSHIKPIVGAMVTMASATQLDAQARRVCFSFLLTLAEQGKGMIRKQAEFASQVVPLAFRFLTELQHTPDWDDPHKVDEGDDDDGFENYKFGREAMDRLANALGGKLFMQVATPMIERAAKDQNNWNVRHAALITLAMMAMGCNKHMEPHIKSILDTYVTSFALNDPHYRVRWAAVDLCAYLSQAFEPEFANDHTAAIFSTLLACMNPSNHWRVTAHACLCVPDVCRGLEVENLLPHMSSFLSAVVPLLGMTSTPRVVESALGAVSSIAAVAKEEFLPFYDAFMPGVKGLIMQCSGAREQHIRTKAIECMGFFAQAVGASKFRPEFAPVMDSLLRMLAAESLPSDDPLHNEIVTACTRICHAMKEEFVPYLPSIIPNLLKSARINDAFVIVNEGEANAYQDRAGWLTSTVEVRQTGRQQVSYNSSLLEEKTLAIRMLFEYCHTLGSAFYPYAQDAAAILVPCVRYQFNDDVRINSVAALPALMRCVKDALASDAAEQLRQCMQLFEFLWPQVIDGMKVESDLDSLGDIIDYFREVIELLPAPLTEAQIDELNQLIYRIVGELLVRCRERDEHSQTEDYDEAQAELFAMENEAEDEFLGHIYSIVNAAVKNAKDTYLTNFHTHLNAIFSAMMQSDDTSLRTSGICVLSQVMEDCPTHPAALSYCEPMFRICTTSAEDEDVPLRQSALFGLGVCAIVMKSRFASEAEQLIALMTRIIMSDLGEEAAVATDNAISAMAKIFIHVYNSGVASAGSPPCPPSVLAAMSKWVHFLPCDGDLLESQKIHAMFAQFICTNNVAVMGDGMSNLPIILGVIAKILARDDWEDVCLPETREQIIDIFRQLQRGMPTQQLRDMVKSMNEEQRKAFQPYFIPELQ